MVPVAIIVKERMGRTPLLMSYSLTSPALTGKQDLEGGKELKYRLDWRLGNCLISNPVMFVRNIVHQLIPD